MKPDLFLGIAAGTLDTIGLIVAAVVLGCLQGYSQWRQSQLLKESKKQMDNVAVRQEVILNKQELMKVLMDGPLGTALLQLAELREQMAQHTQNPKDVAAAEAARNISNQHIQNIAKQDRLVDAQKVVAETAVLENTPKV